MQLSGVNTIASDNNLWEYGIALENWDFWLPVAREVWQIP